MKTTLKIALAGIALFLVAGTANAQQKFGYINSQELLSQMPESDTINRKLEELQVDLANQYQSMQTELNTKSEDLRQNMATMSDAIRQQRDREVTDLFQRIQEFEQSASQEIQRKQIELYTPVMQKAQSAIEKVGQEQGLVCVFDLAAGAVAWYNDSVMVNVLPLVKRSLGIQ